MFTDLHTERACLAAGIFTGSALERLMELGENVFYDPANLSVFRVMSDLYREGEKIDLLIIRTRLQERGEFEKAGGDKYLTLLMQEHSVINVKHAIRTLVKLAHRRRLMQLSSEISDLAKQPGVQNEHILNQIQDVMQQLDLINHDEFVEMSAMFECDNGDVASLYSVEGRYVPTGFKALDSRLIGLFGSELIVIGSRPGVGKTALALNIAQHVAKTKDVLFISLEMSTKQLGLRLISSSAMIDSDMIRRGQLSERDRVSINEHAMSLRSLKLTFTEYTTTLDEITAKIRKYAQTHDVGLVVVDYLQLVQVLSAEQRYVKVGEISRQLKLMSRIYDIPILCPLQISREAEDRAPKMSDLRESGNLEQDADVVMFLHRDPREERSDYLNVLFAKNRSGKAGTMAKIIFRKKFTRFFDLDSEKKAKEKAPGLWADDTALHRFDPLPV